MTEDTKAFIKLIAAKHSLYNHHPDIPPEHLAAFADHLDEINHPAAIAVNKHFQMAGEAYNPHLTFNHQFEYTGIQSPTHSTIDPDNSLHKIETTFTKSKTSPGIAVTVYNATSKSHYKQRIFDAPISVEEAREVADRMGEHKDAAHTYLDEHFGKHKYSAQSYLTDYENALKSANNVPQKP